MKYNLYAFCFLLFALVSCDNKPTLQKYFVDKGEQKNFSTVDIAPDILNAKSIKFTAEEKKALATIHKLNVLFYTPTEGDQAGYDIEKKNIQAVLKTDSYEELMTAGSNKMGVALETKGAGEHIDEFVVFAYNKESGFAVIRVLGKDMTPNDIMTVAGLLKKANLNMDALKPLQQIMTK